MAVYQSLSLTQVSQNQEENSSRVRILWQSTQTGASYNDTRRTARYTVACNGQSPESYTVSYTLPMQATANILDITLTVPHDSRGQGVITVTSWMNTNISAGVVELSQTLQLDTIAQAAGLMATDAPIGGISRLAITRKSQAHTYSLEYQFGELSGFVDESGELESQEVKFSCDSVDFSVPPSFYGQIPNAKEGICRLTLRTYLGSDLVGQPQSAAFTAYTQEENSCPVVTGRVVDTNQATLELTGDETCLVRYGSQALCLLEALPRNGAGLAKQLIAGYEVSDGRLVLQQPQMETVVFAAEDTRGYKTQQTVAVPMVAYRKPSLEIQVGRTGVDSAGLTVAGDCFTGSFGLQENALSAAYSIDGVNFIPLALQTEENRFYAAAVLENMDYAQVYEVTVRVWDRLYSVQKQAILKKTLPVFDWGEKDFAFHVPVAMDAPLGLESGGTGRGQWPEQGVVVKNSTAMDAVAAAPGAFYAGADSLPRFGILPVAQGGTGGGDIPAAWESLGLSPAMELNREYATNQRWLGKTVYTTLVDYGPLPNTRAQAVAHGVAASQILGCRCTASDGRTLPWGGIHAYRADVFANTQSIYIDTEKDYSDLTALVQLWYIK